jgi:sugar porter (SP) family MFS transporter
MRPNSKLLKSTLTGALGGLLFGIDMAAISGALGTITTVYGLNDWTKGMTVAVSPVGTVLGCFAAGILGQRMGSRAALRWAAALYILAALGSTFALGWPMLLTTRFIGGLAIGAASVLGPVYITELAPAAWRGRLVGSFQLMVVTGIVFGYVSNYLVRVAGLGATEWRMMLGVALIPAAIFLVALFGIPPSPRFLIARGETDEALGILREMGATDPAGELAAIQAGMQSEHAVAHEPVFRWKYRWPLFLAISIGAFNQLSGINAILFYQGTIFKAAGFSQVSGDMQAIAIGLTNLIFTLVGMSLIDRFGRKSLLLLGAVGTASCLGGVAWIFSSNSHQSLLIALLAGFIGFFALSQGAVIWVYLGEVFPTSVRSKGQGIGSASHWVVNSVLQLVFPVVVSSFGKSSPFLFFAAATVVQLVVVALFYPETKGQTLEELQGKLVR